MGLSDMMLGGTVHRAMCKHLLGIAILEFSRHVQQTAILKKKASDVINASVDHSLRLL